MRGTTSAAMMLGIMTFNISLTTTLPCTRISLHDQRLRETLSANRQPYLVQTRKHRCNSAASAATATRWALGRSRTQIPNPSMHARRGGQRFGGARPEWRKVESVGIDRREFIFARITTNGFACWIEDFENDRAARVRLQIEIDHRSRRRILGDRFIARQRRADKVGSRR